MNLRVWTRLRRWYWRWRNDPSGLRVGVHVVLPERPDGYEPDKEPR